MLLLLEDETADLVFLDPPFNLGKRYGSKSSAEDRLAESDYTRYITEVLLRCCDVLKPGGALYLYHVPKYAVLFAGVLQQHLRFRHWIAVCMKNGFVRGERLYPAHYALVYFTKGEPASFHRPKVDLARCRKCKEPIKDYGGYRNLVSAGVNLSDFWEDISPVRHNKHKNRRANELPLKLLDRVLQISGAPKGIIVDPFAGSGTSLIAAMNHKMYCIAGDRDETACSTMWSRISMHRRMKEQ